MGWLLWFHECMARETAPAPPEDAPCLPSRCAAPTVRQVYALAAALCELTGELFPETRLAASEAIERLRLEVGHPAPWLEDVPLWRGRRRRRGPYPWWLHLRPAAAEGRQSGDPDAAR
jgi:hypothetical protein